MTDNSSEASQTSGNHNKKSQKTSVWDLMLKYAKLQQQEYYELLSEYTMYKECEYKYLKQNIGFALFGPPSDITGEVHNQCQTDDITDQLHYKPMFQAVIDKIYERVHEFGKGTVQNKCIYFGIIFNVTFSIKNNSIEVINSIQATEQNNSEESKMDFQSTPIFKIKRIKINKNTKIDKNTNFTCEEWYIDAWARVYKSWASYKEENVLPACTMVIPKDGFYQPDPNCVMTEEYSTVWLEVLKSPRCSLASTFVNHADTTATVVGTASLVLSIAAIFTPAAPVVVGAVATGAISGAWSAGRSVYNLVDRSTHEQSINIKDKEALPLWLSIAGGALSAATTAGNILFMQAIRNGSNINMFMKFAYNTVLVSNLGVNGCGVAYNAYCIYEKYQNGDNITMYDVLSVGTHILFFGSAVMNFKFAGDLIESTQGKILDDYRATLRSKRLRKAFNRANREAAANNPDKIAQNAEVIRYINNKTELQLQNNLQKNSKNNSQSTTKNKSQSTSNNSSKTDSQSTSKNSSQTNSKNNSQSTSKNNSQTNSENNTQSNLKNNSQSTSKNNSQSNVKNNSKNNSENSFQSASKNNSQTNSENNSQSNLKTNSKNNSQSTSKNNSQTNSENNTQSNLKNNSKNNSQSTSKNNLQSNSNNSSKTDSQSTSKNSSQTNSENNTQSNLKNNSQTNSENNSQNNLKNSSQSTSNSNSQSNLQNNSQSTTKNNSQSNSENNSGSTSKSNLQNNSYGNSFTPKSIVSFDNGKITINDIIMIDPIKLVAILVASKKRFTKKREPTNREDRDSEEMLWKLRTLLLRLRTQIFSKDDNKIANIPDISKFDEICEDMKYMKDALIILPQVFEIAVTLVQYVGRVEVIDKAVHFVWCYVKQSVTRVYYTASSFITNPKIQGKISSIITALFEHMSCVVQELLPAFRVYVKAIN